MWPTACTKAERRYTNGFLIGFPIFPMDSVRLRDLGSEGIPFLKRTTNYEFIEDVPLVRFVMITLGILLPFGLRFLSRRFMSP